MIKLLEEITNCENIRKTFSRNSETPCKKIIDSQNRKLEDFQLPEPWNGDLENCKILFISSNPSFNEKEMYPLKNWKPEDVSDFFINRFSHERKWVKNELHPLPIVGDYPKGWVRFWGAIRSIARIILDTNSPIPGKDYAITEIVHCKSVSEIGVKEAMDTCINKYLDRIINITKANVLVCLGEKVSNIMKRKYQIENAASVVEMPETGKLLLFLPHPNARKERRLDKILTQNELSMVKSKVK